MQLITWIYCWWDFAP